MGVIRNQGVLTNPPDFKISIDKYTWAVHSNKLARSAFFKKLSESGFKVTQLHEWMFDCDADLQRAGIAI